MTFILLKPTFGKFGILDGSQPLSDIAVDAGSLWKEIDDANVARKVFLKFRKTAGQDGVRTFESVEERSLFIMESADRIAPIPIRWAQLLMAVADLKERLLLYRTENALYAASHLSIGDAVTVQLATGRVIPGHLRWIGEAPLSNRGNYFGVEVASGCGVTDGKCNGIQLFKCFPASALFVPVSMLWFPPSISPSLNFSSPVAMASFYDERNGLGHNAAMGSEYQANSPCSNSEATRSSLLIDLRSPKDQKVPETAVASNKELRRRQNMMDRTLVEHSPAASALPPLTVGERVVYLRDGDMEYGTVRWIGHISGFTVDMAGVEFDNPIGSGSGMYSGKRLFSSRMNHASLMPIGGLIRAVDFDKGEATDYGSVQKNLLVDFEGANDTTIWSSDPPGFSSESPSPPLIDTSGEDLDQVRKVLPVDQHRIPIGSHVQVLLEVNITTPSLAYDGVVRWIGILPGKDELMVGVELEKDLPYWIRTATDGRYQNERYFTCDSRRGIFVGVDKIRVRDIDNFDGRKYLDGLLTESVPNLPPPWKLNDVRRIDEFVGKGKGIQGKSNSCYLDATLFALFAGVDAFDAILSRPKKPSDCDLYDELRTCLKVMIVSPLRWNGYVDHSSVMKLRRLIAHALPDSRGWTDEEKDPEELINALFGPTLGVQPDIQLTTGQSSYICQLVVEDTWQKASLTSVQTLLERSFFCSDVQLKSMPKRLIVQLPRYGKQKLYDFIVPTLELNLSSILANRSRQCGMCNQPAKFQCKECYLVSTNEYEMTFFCGLCFSKFHAALRKNNDHTPTIIPRPVCPIDHGSPYLQLSSVICIESSHYVSFTRIRDSRSSKWLFCDSMADREGGEITGQNIPQIVGCDDFFDQLLRPCNRHLLVEALPETDHRHGTRSRRSSNPLPPLIDRLLKDCYICIYTNQE